MPVDVNRVHRHFAGLEERRQSHEALWRETAKYYLPSSMHWSTQGGTRSALLRNVNVFDDTPAWAAGRFAAAMLGMIMNPAQKWLEFELYTEEDNLSTEAKQYLSMLRDHVLFVLQSPEVGFYDAYHEHLLDYGIFGEACLLIDRNPETRMPRFTPFPLEQCYIGMGAGRTPDTVFRRYEMTVQQISDFFGNDERLPDCVTGKLDAGLYLDKLTVIHGVFPRKHGVAKGFAQNKPYASVYYLESTKELLRESGFDYFPFSCPRFMLFASEEHGQGPGTMTLPNVRSMNTMIKTLMTADQRKAKPAWISQRRGWMKPLNFNPDAINYYDGMEIDKALIPLGNVGDPKAGKDWIEMFQQQIMRAFYLDRLNAPDKKAEMKEVEVLVGEDERMRDLVPQLSRLHAESISAIVLNVVDYCMDDMPEPPADLANVGIKLRYLSPLARAQRLLEVSNANRTLQNVVVPLAQIDPSALDAVSIPKMVKWSLKQTSFPVEVLNSDDEIAAKQEQQAQQQQAAMGLEAAQGAAQVAKDFSTAQKNAPGALQGFL